MIAENVERKISQKQLFKIYIKTGRKRVAFSILSGIIIFLAITGLSMVFYTYRFNACQLSKMVNKYFEAVMVKHEQLKVKVEIDETMDGHLPMRWGGIFKK